MGTGMGNRVMRELLFVLGSTRPLAATSDRVSLADVESRLRELGQNAQRSVADSKQSAIAAGVIGGALVVAGAYLHGRRRGRRRATVLEIRRV